MIKILIIDDHPLVIDGIKTMLKDVSWMQVSQSAKTAKEAMHFLFLEVFDIALLDISLPDMDGLELCERIRQQNQTIKILGLTSANEASIITQFLQRGGNGYLLKNMERDELITAIDAVLDDKIFLSKSANEKVLQQYQNLTSAISNSPVLTRREKEILSLLHKGFNGPQIAEQLFLSAYTVETHRKNLFQKFNVHTTQMLLKTAMDNRLIPA